MSDGMRNCLQSLTGNQWQWCIVNNAVKCIDDGVTKAAVGGFPDGRGVI